MNSFNKISTVRSVGFIQAILTTSFSFLDQAATEFMFAFLSASALEFQSQRKGIFKLSVVYRKATLLIKMHKLSLSLFLMISFSLHSDTE